MWVGLGEAEAGDVQPSELGEARQFGFPRTECLAQMHVEMGPGPGALYVPG